MSKVSLPAVGINALIRQAKIELAKRVFWEYCKLTNPDFYSESKVYLRDICNALQGVYEQTLINEVTGLPYKYISISIPPRHGKTRTCCLFEEWVFGNNITKKVISISYNADYAARFSKSVRDNIMERRIDPNDRRFIFNDIFPLVSIKRGDSRSDLWSLEGQNMSYLATSFKGSLTGIGANLCIVDDPIRSAEEAHNIASLDAIYDAYCNTLIQRLEGNDYMIIIAMTRWSTVDLVGRVTASAPNDWLELKMKAYDEETDTMLCDEVMNKASYIDKTSEMSPDIKAANYSQEPYDIKGKLYTALLTTTTEPLPYNAKGDIMFTKIVGYGDTADEGKDYTCFLIAGLYDKKLWVLDIVYSQEKMEFTESLVASSIAKVYLDYPLLPFDIIIEANNGGKGFARNVSTILAHKESITRVPVKWVTQRSNKRARIESHAYSVETRVIFPASLRSKYKEYYSAMFAFQREGKNIHDDAPDATTGLVEKFIAVKQQLRVGAGIY